MQTIRFAYLHEPPFCYTHHNMACGTDVDLARSVFKIIGTQLSFIETEFQNLIPGLNDDRWDMTTGLFVTDERKRQMLFSDPIWKLPDGLMIRKEDQNIIKSYASIAESHIFKLAVVADQIQHQTALLCGISEAQIRIYSTQLDAARSVYQRETDAYASVALAHQGFIDQNSNLELAVNTISEIEKAAAIGAFGIAKTRPELKIVIDHALKICVPSTL